METPQLDSIESHVRKVLGEHFDPSREQELEQRAWSLIELAVRAIEFEQLFGGLQDLNELALSEVGSSPHRWAARYALKNGPDEFIPGQGREIVVQVLTHYLYQKRGGGWDVSVEISDMSSDDEEDWREALDKLRDEGNSD